MPKIDCPANSWEIAAFHVIMRAVPNLRLAILSVILALSTAAGVIEYDVGKQNDPNPAYAPWHIHVWAPSTASSTPARVMLFAPGFAGFMDDEFCRRLG